MNDPLIDGIEYSAAVGEDAARESAGALEESLTQTLRAIEEAETPEDLKNQVLAGYTSASSRQAGEAARKGLLLGMLAGLHSVRLEDE